MRQNQWRHRLSSYKTKPIIASGQRVVKRYLPVNDLKSRKTVIGFRPCRVLIIRGVMFNVKFNYIFTLKLAIIARVLVLYGSKRSYTDETVFYTDISRHKWRLELASKIQLSRFIPRKRIIKLGGWRSTVVCLRDLCWWNQLNNIIPGINLRRMYCTWQLPHILDVCGCVYAIIAF